MKYTIGSFLDNDQVLIPEKLLNQTNYPFSIERVRNFFRYFYFSVFSSNQIVKSIAITDGAMKPPSLNSYANGLLISTSADNFSRYGKSLDTVGIIYFTCCPDKDNRDMKVNFFK